MIMNDEMSKTKKKLLGCEGEKEKVGKEGVGLYMGMRRVQVAYA